MAAAVNYNKRPDTNFDFMTYGAVAQLGERRVRNAKVGGSSPIVSS